jgi:MarR family transcriptional regulator, lower aerobic nicotinate degradation pathway regulator
MAERQAAEGPGPGGQPLPPSMRDRTTFLLYRAGELSHSMANEMLAPIRLTARQVGILTLVIDLQPMNQKALGDQLRIDRTTMVTLIDDLEEKRYVSRRRHPGDRRAFLIEPTAAGRSAKAQAIKILDEQKRRFLTPLTADQQEQLLALLKLLQRPPSLVI